MCPRSNKTEAADEAVDRVVVPIVEETATIGKTETVSQRVRVSTVVEDDEQIFEDILTREEIDVERVPIGRIVEIMPETRTEGDVLIVPVVEERAVVSKQLVLVEEVRIRKRHENLPARVPVSLKRHRVVIEDKTPSSREPYPTPNRNRR